MTERVVNEPHEPPKNIPDFAIEKILIAGNRGPCGGVVAAIGAAYKITGANENVYTNNDVVHHRPIMDEFGELGFINVGEEWKNLPEGTPFIFSAHGHTEEDMRIAREKGLDIYDTTCSLVIRVQLGVRKAEQNNRFVIYIGRDGHPETRSVMSFAIPDNRFLVRNLEDAESLEIPEGKVAEVFSQTTLMGDEVADIEDLLHGRFGERLVIHKKKDLCDATINRQSAVKEMIPEIDMLFVVGSPHSDNSKALRGTAESRGVDAHLFDYLDEIQPEWFTTDKKVLGLTSGASVLDRFAFLVVDWMKKVNPDIEVVWLDPVAREYTDAFKLPRETQEKLNRLS